MHRVTLLTHTPNPEEAVYTAARLCYSSKDMGSLMRDAEGISCKSLIERVRAMGHLSVFEHASFTFGLEGVSRAMTHQLVRHRIASYSQRSQRYVDEEGFRFVVPPKIAQLPEAQELFSDVVERCRDAYARLLGLGVAKEDARYLLPNACCSSIVVTMNARELLHFFTLRCCRRAQWEIREVAKDMLRLCKKVAPLLFENAGPSCLRGPCPEGEMGCGHSQDVREEFLNL
jgi:thymidylate synthase (FAD)